MGDMALTIMLLVLVIFIVMPVFVIMGAIVAIHIFEDYMENEEYEHCVPMDDQEEV